MPGLQRSPHPNPPPQGGRESPCAFDIFPLPPCGGGSGWGVPPYTRTAKITRWHRRARANCGAIRPRQKNVCGQSFDSSRSAAIAFDGKPRLDLTSSISSASPGGSSSRLMAGSMIVAPLKTMREQLGWSERDSVSCGFGTTRCSAISRVSTRSSSRISQAAASPRPNPPPQGGRGLSDRCGHFPLSRMRERGFVHAFGVIHA